MSKAFTLLVVLSATGLGAYGISQQREPEPRPIREKPAPVVANASEPAPALPESKPDPRLASKPLLPRAAALFLQPGTVYLSQPQNPAFSTVAMVQNPSIGGSGQSGYTGVGNGYAFAYYFFTCDQITKGGLPFLEVWADPNFTGFTPGALGSPGPNRLLHRLFMGINQNPPSLLPAYGNMTGAESMKMGGITVISP